VKSSAQPKRFAGRRVSSDFALPHERTHDLLARTSTGRPQDPSAPRDTLNLRVPSVAVDLAGATERLGLPSRLEAIPLTAQSRGIFFNMLRDDLGRRRLLGVPDIARLLGQSRRSYGYYPTRDLVEAYGVAGAMLNADPLEGVRQLFSGTARYFSSTWYGKAFARYLKPDPKSALSWIERSREHVANYGRWRLEIRGPEHAVFHMFDEYFWIEAAQRGGCEGLLLACGVEGEVVAKLDEMFVGRLDIRWQMRN
jgi:uncharacterized protein (TIGR02265 family)